MRKVFSGRSVMECDLVKSVLDANGVRCMVKNEFVAPLAGEVPFGDVWPELWVDDADFDKAVDLINAYKEPQD